MDGLAAAIDAVLHDLAQVATAIDVTIADSDPDFLAVTFAIPDHATVAAYLPATTDLIDEDQTSSIGPLVAAELADRIQSDIMECVVGGAWPRCPIHGRHPLRVGGTEWTCPVRSDRWPIGDLPTTTVSEPKVEDNTVRWWSDDLGWGVVAHHEGDIFVLFSMLDGSGYRNLQEDDRVEVKLAHRMQGRLRAAQHVRLIARPPRHG
jgi:CspA family cold shock protein